MTAYDLMVLNDSRVTSHAEGFDVHISFGNFHVGLSRRLLWSVSDVHSGLPAACTALASNVSACSSHETPGAAVAAVLDCDGTEVPQ